MDNLQIAVVGCGDIAFRSYLPALRELSDQVDLAAVCSKSLEHAQRAKDLFGARSVFTNYEDMLNQAKVDAVVILTPTGLHGKMAIQAMEAGKHVYIEKVMAVDPVEADCMVETADRQHLIFSCAPSTIFNSANQYVKNAITSGEIGQITYIHAQAAHGGPGRWDDYTSDPTWFYQPGGGPLFDLAVYPVHILTQTLGPVKQVIAFSGTVIPEITMTAKKVRGQTLKVQVDDTTPMILDFGNATFATLDVSYNILSSRLPGTQFWGTTGGLSAPLWFGREVGVFHQGDADWSIHEVPETLYDRLNIAGGLIHWLECIHFGKQPVNNGRHGRHVLDVLLAAQNSARTRRAIEISTTF